MHELPSGTVTLLITDVEGSTRLLGEVGPAGYSDELEQHNRAIREAAAQHGGTEANTQGDSFTLVFGEPEAALAAAEQVQRALSSGRLRVRMGIHTGAAEARETGYVGAAVHIGAHVAAAASGGQILVSGEAREQLRRGDGLVELGSHRLKDVPQPVRLFQVGDRVFPALRTLTATNLPVPRAPLVGRGRELGDLTRLVMGRRARLVTITGPGGVGKTRLALALATSLIEDLDHGVAFVDLAPIRDPATVVPTIGSALGAGEKLEEHLGEKQVLLFLDNFEQVAPAAPALGDLLAACPNLQLLTTSREALRLRGEQEYPLSPLAEAAAVELFRQRAEEVAPELDPPYDLVRELCERLDGLPLAIELAAARVDRIRVEQLLSRLDQRLALLTTEGEDVPERQRTLRATIEWSHALLQPHEQRLFRRAAVFAGSWDLDAAEEIVDADIDTLGALVDKSLVRRADERFSTLETIREFALDQLEASDEAEELRRRHAEYFAGVGPALGWRVRRSDQEAIRLLDADEPNLRAAFDWALARREESVLERLVETLWNYWLIRGRTAEGYARARAAFDQAESPSPLFLELVGELARFRGEYEVAAGLKRRAIDAYTSAGADVPDLAAALADLAETLVALGRTEEAVEPAARALDIRARLGEPPGVAHAQTAMARVALARGEAERALVLADATIPVLREGGLTGDLAWSQTIAATALRLDGRAPEARDRLHEALRLARSADERTAVVAGLDLAAALAGDEGRWEDAVRLFGAARTWRDRAGYAFEAGGEVWNDAGAALGAPTRLRLAAEGASWSLDDAVDHALRDA